MTALTPSGWRTADVAVAERLALKRPATTARPVCHNCTRPKHAQQRRVPASPAAPHGPGSAAAPYDPLRDGPLRYLGYANEVGEAFQAFVGPTGVALSYVVALAYVLVDTRDKWGRAYAAAAEEEEQAGPTQAQTQPQAAAVAPRAAPAGTAGDAAGDAARYASAAAGVQAADTLAWQLLASVALPGYIIHQVVHATAEALAGAPAQALLAAAAAGVGQALGAAPEALAGGVAAVLPTIIGLAAIPLIAHPIDHGVDWLLDRTLRPLLAEHLRSSRQAPPGAAAAGQAQAPA